MTDPGAGSDRSDPDPDRPDPNTRPCDGCGHIWFAGERRHEYVDPGTGGHEDGVLCVLCRRQSQLAPAFE